MKAVLDYTKRVGLIIDDSYCQKATVEWVEKEIAGPTGCTITLTGIEHRE